MSFSRLTEHQQGTDLLQRSLEKGRLAHGYLLSGGSMPALEQIARSLAQTLSCQHPVRRGELAAAIDCCGECSPCRRIEGGNFPDVLWLRPESKSRIISVDQIRQERIPADAQQLVVVHSNIGSDNTSTLQTFEKRGTSWSSVDGPMDAHLGANGLRASRTEGDKTTPAGTFSLTEAFGIKPFDATKLPYRTVGPNDWWVSGTMSRNSSPP